MYYVALIAGVIALLVCVWGWCACRSVKERETWWEILRRRT